MEGLGGKGPCAPEPVYEMLAVPQLLRWALYEHYLPSSHSNLRRRCSPYSQEREGRSHGYQLGVMATVRVLASKPQHLRALRLWMRYRLAVSLRFHICKVIL